MGTFTFKQWPGVLTLGLVLGVGSPGADELTAERSVIRDGAPIAPLLRSSVARVGDLYVATRIGGQLWFLTSSGWSRDPLPWESSAELIDAVALFEFRSVGVAPGKYPLFVFTTDPGADPLDFRNWHGELNGVKRLNFSINEGKAVSTDLDDDGWPDDDRNKDGFSDDDRDYDGLHDDDHDEDGLHDDDLDEDGYHDDDFDRDGYHDDDSDLDGFHDDDHDHDGIRDDVLDDGSSDDSSSADSSDASSDDASSADSSDASSDDASSADSSDASSDDSRDASV